MDLAKSWSAAVVVYLIGSIFTVQVAVAAKSTPEELTGSSGSIIWNAVPALLIYLVMAGLSAVVHSEPRRTDATRHALAVLPVPALLIVGSVGLGFAQGWPPAGIVAGAISGAFGTFVGWWVAGRLRKRDRAPQTSGNGYF
jgi:hypothetical protein